ncbi:acyltransferase family protein [Stappia taiwanensis]|uniref:Acyltransferase family protein n=1 Tax=Stappia taiwanensis TaxID=992267 RepID=A0A838XNW9_9HYPH|nr:acyltransferase family protein [Stappia taiwanensis]MBA4611912.1 acyltransferase family protein [Stappia taiwanensis]GGF03757.1 acyltransferase [Stappia taiwanensis]
MASAANGRIDWVDTAKGFCIIFVVMMHSTIGVEIAAGEPGWMGAIVAFAKPFRMPDFFMISGLFLGLVIDRPWRSYLDRKVVHFAYFYVLWLTIQFAVKAPMMAGEIGWAGVAGQYLLAYVQPFGTLWFIYMLPVMFVITKALHRAGLPWYLVLGAAALLQIAPIHTGSVLIDEFASRYVFFYCGYVFAARAFALAHWARHHLPLAIAGLLAWGLVNGGLVFTGYSEWPVISLALGGAGALAVIVFSALLTQLGVSAPLRHCGENSIVVYLAFFFPMAATRIILLKTGIIPDVGWISLIVTAAGVIAPLVLWWLIQRTGLGTFLFVRPAWARLSGTGPGRTQPQAAE